MNDKALTDLIKNDPERGVKKLTDRYSGLIFSIVKTMLKGVCDSSEIEDCAAEVISSFCIAPDSFRGDASLKNYLCVCARNRAKSVLRKKSAYVTETLDDAEDIVCFTNIEDEAAKRDAARRVLLFIKSLGQPDRDIALQKLFYCRRSKEIASELGLSVSNVDTRFSRILAKLRNELEGDRI